MLKVLRDANEPVKVRLAALQALQAASFSVLAFEGCRGDYIATLRQVAEDRDPELRQRVLGMLMREKDGFAQKKLLEGLHDPDKALVPPEKALQLLGNDVHADAYEVARAIVRKPPNEAARREALRLLGADATAAPLFEKLLLDKDELREIRQIAASALYALQPDRMQKHARDILLDKSDYDDIKATSLSALTQLGDKTLSDDKALMKSVDRFSTGKTTRAVQADGAAVPHQVRPVMTELQFAALVDGIAADAQRRDGLLDLLREEHAVYRDRSATTIARMRGWVLLALERGGVSDAALAFVLEELDTGTDPYLVAAAARALRSYPRPGRDARAVRAGGAGQHPLSRRAAVVRGLRRLCRVGHRHQRRARASGDAGLARAARQRRRPAARGPARAGRASAQAPGRRPAGAAGHP